MKIPFFCIASGLILCRNARRTRYFKSESSCNTCFGSPTYKQINTISVLFPAVQAVTISSSCNRRLQIACFPSPIGNCMQSINWRAAVCPPQRAFNWIRRPCRRHGTACRIQSAKIRMPISICRSQTPLISPPSAPAHSARPPKNDQAGSQKTIPHGSCYEYASKMQASNCFFYAFHVSTHFLHHIFSKMLFLLERGTHFCKTTSSDFNQKIHFFDPQTASIRAFVVI